MSKRHNINRKYFAKLRLERELIWQSMIEKNQELRVSMGLKNGDPDPIQVFRMPSLARRVAS